MLDLAFVRENLDEVRQRLSTRGFSFDIETFGRLDGERKNLIHEVERLRQARNSASEEIAGLMKQKVDASEKRNEVKAVGQKIKEIEEALERVESELLRFAATVPNLPDPDVPVGLSEDENVEVRRFAEPPKFDFEPKAHWDLCPALGILDLERATKITGSRFPLLAGLGARLERALINFMLDVHTREHGYTEVLPPFLVNSQSLFGTGNLPKFADDLFKVEKFDLWLVPTAEVPVTNLYRSETLNADDLPIRLCAYTPCFRSEAGSYGRDVRGIIRQHQFQKVELVKFTRPDQSYEELEKLTRDAEDILERLGLPYRRVVLCTGDMGFSSAKTFDIEVWLPGQNAYKEISSCSNFEAFQARRANIRAKAGKGKSEFVHTLNGSGLAVGRTWVAILENYQQKDGSVVIPDALRPYLGVERIEPPKR